MARRDDRAYGAYVREEQRSQSGCSASRMPSESESGPRPQPVPATRHPARKPVPVRGDRRPGAIHGPRPAAFAKASASQAQGRACADAGVHHRPARIHCCDGVLRILPGPPKPWRRRPARPSRPRSSAWSGERCWRPAMSCRRPQRSCWGGWGRLKSWLLA